MLLNKRIPVQYFFRRLWGEAILVGLIATGGHQLKLWLSTEPLLPFAIPAILGTCISLLLAFRTAQSYDRWWEARKIWGAIVNDSRTLMHQLHGFATATSEGDDGTSRILKRIAFRQIAWTYVLAESLRGTLDMEKWESFLEVHEKEALIRHTNKANGLLQFHTNDVKELFTTDAINEFHQIQLDSTILRLTQSMGMCERIKSTVFPRMYSALIHNFIYLLVAMLTFGFGTHLGYWDILVVATIGLTLFIIEKTAIMMQDPFENRPTDTAMTTISRNIEINIRQMSGDTNVPEKFQSESFFAM